MKFFNNLFKKIIVNIYFYLFFNICNMSHRIFFTKEKTVTGS